MRDMYSNTDVKTSLVPDIRTASANGAAVDLVSARSVVMLFICGTFAGSGVFDWGLEDSADGVTWAAVAPKYLVSDAPHPLGANWTYRVGYVGSKRYIRAVVTYVSGTSQRLSAVAVVDPLRKPVA